MRIKLLLLNRVLKATGLWPTIIGFIVLICIFAVVVEAAEPGIEGYADSLWYIFASFTTIGYGDYVAVTTAGRIATVVISLYGIFIVALIPAVIVNFYIEYTSRKNKATLSSLLSKLENLSSLSKEELDEISKMVRERRTKF